MTINITTKFDYALTSIDKVVSAYLSEQQKQMAAVVAMVFVLLTALYCSFRCYRKLRSWTAQVKKDTAKEIPSPVEKSIGTQSSVTREDVSTRVETQPSSEMQSQSSLKEDFKEAFQSPQAVVKRDEEPVIPPTRSPLSEKKGVSDSISDNLREMQILRDDPEDNFVSESESDSESCDSEESFENSSAYPYGLGRRQQWNGIPPFFVDADIASTSDSARRQNLVATFACCFHTEECFAEIDQLLMRMIGDEIPSSDHSDFDADEVKSEEAVQILLDNLTRLHDALPGDMHAKRMKIYWSQAVEEELIPHLIKKKECAINSLLFVISAGETNDSPFQASTMQFNQQLHFKGIDDEEGHKALLNQLTQQVRQLSEKTLNVDICGLLEASIKEIVGEDIHEIALENDLLRTAILFSFKATLVHHLNDFVKSGESFDISLLASDERRAFLIRLLKLKTLSDRDLRVLRAIAPESVDQTDLTDFLPPHLLPVQKIPFPFAPFSGQYRKSQVVSRCASPAGDESEFLQWAVSPNKIWISNLSETCAQHFASCFHTSERIEEIELYLLQACKKVIDPTLVAKDRRDAVTKALEKLCDNLLRLQQALYGQQNRKFHKIYWSQAVDDILIPHMFWVNEINLDDIFFNIVSGEAGESLYQADELDYQQQLQFVGLFCLIDQSAIKSTQELKDNLFEGDFSIFQTVLRERLGPIFYMILQHNKLLLHAFTLNVENQVVLNLLKLKAVGYQVSDEMSDDERDVLLKNLCSADFSA